MAAALPLLLTALVPANMVATAADPCNGDPAANADHVWFLGVVYDEELRDDFKQDVGNFEIFLDFLRDTYCIPDSQAEILAFWNNYSDGGNTYDTASEANVKAELASMGSAASAHSDSIFFYFHSSHGLMWSGALGSDCAIRLVGSFAALRSGGGENGEFYDCELGEELNDHFDPDVRMAVVVDCSFCGGFSDSVTAVSGTNTPDDPAAYTPASGDSSGIVADNRVVISGCAITTECFGDGGSGSNNAGGNLYEHMVATATGWSTAAIDGFTAVGFPDVDGVNALVWNGAPFNQDNGVATMSEWFWASVWHTHLSLQHIDIQQQYRMKYGFDNIVDDIPVAA